MKRGHNVYGTFPDNWIAAAHKIASDRASSNDGRRQANQDRGASQNLKGDIVGILGERIAQWVRPDLGVSLQLYRSGADAPKSDSACGIDIKSSPWGRRRVLINARQARGLKGVVVVIVDQTRARFWMSETIPGCEVRCWPVFDGPYNDPAHYRFQSDLMVIA